MSTETHVIRGTFHWAKVLGAPRLNKFTDEKEWSVDVTPDKEGRALLRKLGIADRLREPKDGDPRTETFLSFRHSEFKADGTKADPIRIVNSENQPWPDNTLIGNGTVGDCKFIVRDYGKGKKKGVYIRALRVLELVPYIHQDFAPLSSDDEFFAGESESPGSDGVAKPFPLPDGMEPTPELDDDIPV